jgi:hypothetical protein
MSLTPPSPPTRCSAFSVVAQFQQRGIQRSNFGQCCLFLFSKSFLADERNFSEPLMRFAPRRREGPQRFTQKRPPTFVSALASIAVVETSKVSAFARFWEHLNFRLFQQYPPGPDVPAKSDSATSASISCCRVQPLSRHSSALRTASRRPANCGRAMSLT